MTFGGSTSANVEVEPPKVKTTMKNNFLFSKKIIYRQFGFTMIEMLVVMFIIVSVTIFSLANYRAGQRQYTLTQAVQQLVSDIRKAQNMALSGFGVAGQYNGYGVYINEDDSYYIIYGNENASPNYQSSDDIIETISLPDRIVIQSVSPASGKLHIFFEPPQPITYLSGDTTAGVSKTITLGLEGSSLSETVKVTTAGLIQVE